MLLLKISMTFSLFSKYIFVENVVRKLYFGGLEFRREVDLLDVKLSILTILSSQCEKMVSHCTWNTYRVSSDDLRAGCLKR